MVMDRDLAWGSELTIRCKITCSVIVHLKPVYFLLTMVAPIKFNKRKRKGSFSPLPLLGSQLIFLKAATPFLVSFQKYLQRPSKQQCELLA